MDLELGWQMIAARSLTRKRHAAEKLQFSYAAGFCFCAVGGTSCLRPPPQACKTIAAALKAILVDSGSQMTRSAAECLCELQLHMGERQIFSERSW